MKALLHATQTHNIVNIKYDFSGYLLRFWEAEMVQHFGYAAITPNVAKYVFIKRVCNIYSWRFVGELKWKLVDCNDELKSLFKPIDAQFRYVHV